MWRTSVRLGGLALLAQGLQLGLQVVLARRYGTGAQVDAYVAAVTVPQLAVAFLVGPGSQLLVPLLAREHLIDRARYADARNAALLLVLALGVAAALALLLAPGAGLALAASGLRGPAAALAPGYLRWAALALPAAALTAHLSQAHHARGRMLLPAALGIASAAGQLGGFLALHPSQGLRALLLVQLVGSMAQAALLLASELGHARGRMRLRHPVVRELGRLGLPILVVAVNVRVSVSVDRHFASLLGDGSLALLYYAERWLALGQAVVVMPLVTVLYTRLARRATDAAGTGAALAGTLFAGLPLAAGTWVVAPDVAALLLGTDAANAARLAACLRAYAGVLALAAYGSLLVRAFYVAGDTRTPMLWGGLFSMATNLLLDALVVHRFGVAGIAAASSLNAALVLGILTWRLERARPGVLGMGCIRSGARALAGCAAVAALAGMLDAALPGTEPASRALRIGWLLALCPLGYLVVTRALGSPEARELTGP